MTEEFVIFRVKKQLVWLGMAAFMDTLSWLTSHKLIAISNLFSIILSFSLIIHLILIMQNQLTQRRLALLVWAFTIVHVAKKIHRIIHTFTNSDCTSLSIKRQLKQPFSTCHVTYKVRGRVRRVSYCLQDQETIATEFIKWMNILKQEERVFGSPLFATNQKPNITNFISQLPACKFLLFQFLSLIFAVFCLVSKLCYSRTLLGFEFPFF